jgi:phosphate transport system substrate-binding protein
MRTRTLPVLAPALAVVLGLAACGEEQGQPGGGAQQGQKLSGNIAGAGASSQDAAMESWIAGFQEQNPDVTISYDPVGSGGGREQFVEGGTLFAGSDSALKDEELKGAQKRCGGVDNLIEVPTYISPIAIVYNLEGVPNLQLSPETLASIFKQDITNWNDPAIAKDNPGAQLPDQRITAVNRSDESGTTENFVEYMAKVAPDVWDFEVDGNWPVKGGEAAQGTSGVVDAVKNGQGAIGYADASQAGELGVAKIKVGEEFAAPTPESAAAIVDKSEETDDKGKFVVTYDLARDTKEAGTYPIVLVSYELACTKYDSPDEGKVVKAFMSYIVGQDGQGVAAKAAGSAPISDALRSKIQPAVDAIGG